MYRLLTVFAAAAVIALPSSAQTFQRRATIVGGGGGDRGKCTIEVVVDGAAEVSIRGDQGTIRNLSGNPASWRRFECTSAMPANAGDFRFEGIDGRGRQDLIRDPRNGGVAVIRIEDTKGGQEGYTFDVMWGGYQNPGRGSGYPGNDRGPGYQGNDRGPGYAGSGYPGAGRGPNRWSTEQAIEGCRDSIRIEARNRFRGRRVEFLNMRIDDNPGRNDFVMGGVEVFRGQRLEDRYRFSCSVDFNSGRVRTAQIEARPASRDWRGDAGGMNPGGMNSGGANRALQTCEVAVENRLRRDGFSRSEFSSVRMDDAPGRNDWVVGNARAFGQRGAESFNFSCSVNLRDGEVRSVNVDRR
ncbi:MAG: hypothetical protein ABI806_18380 [Candidatus Solibacter sp.]